MEKTYERWGTQTMSQNYKIVERLGAECFCKNCPTCEAASLIQELGEALEPFDKFLDALALLGGPSRVPPGQDFYVLESSVVGRRALNRDDFERARAILSKLKEA